jgi:hypothetical protein
MHGTILDNEVNSISNIFLFFILPNVSIIVPDLT